MVDINAVKDAFEQEANLLGAQAVADLAKGYANAWEKLYAGWQPLADRVLAARGAGMPIRPGDLFRMERFQAMMEQARAAYNDIAFQGRGVGLSTVGAAFDMAVQDFRAGVRDLANMGILVPNAGDWNVSLDREALMAALGYSATGGPLHDLFAAVAVDGVKATRRALVSGIVAGKGTDQIARDMRKVLALNLYRSQLIARTEAHRVYREVSRRNAEANPDAFDGWVWRAACDPRTCAICWSKHGTIHPAKERMVSHPGCRCAAVPNPRSFASIVGEPIPGAVAAFRATGAELFAAKGLATHLRVLGPRRLELYRQGVRLSQMVEEGPRNRWGRTPRLIPLSRLVGVRPRGGGHATTPGGGQPVAAPIAAPTHVRRVLPQRPMFPAERARNDRQIAAGKPPLEWQGKRWGIPGRAVQKSRVRHAVVPPARPQRPVSAAAAAGGPRARAGGVAPAPARLPAPPRVPTPVAPRVPTPAPLFPAQPSRVTRHPTQPLVRVHLPAVPAGARPMNAGEVERQAKRQAAGQGDLVWKPNRGVMAGQGHWGRALLQSRTRSARARVAFPSRPAMLVNNPAGGQQIAHPPIPRGARAMNAAELARQERYYQNRQGRLVWKPDPGGAMGQGHWGARVGAPVPAPAPAPQAAMGHAPRGGAEPRPAVLAAGGAQLRRWRRWQAENPNARPWQEPPAAYLAGKAPRAKIATIGPLAGVRGGERLALRKLAEQTPVFGGKRAKTGQNQPMGWDPNRRRLGRAQPGEFTRARARSASLARRQQGFLAQAMPGYAPAAPAAPRPKTVLRPLPAPKIVKAAARDKTGTHPGMPPKAAAHPTATAEPPNPVSVLAKRVRTARVEALMEHLPIARRAPSQGGTSSEGFEAWLKNPKGGKEIHVYIKPTSGQHATAAGRNKADGTAGIKPKSESEREYAAFRLNRMLGSPLDHQVSVIRDFGTWVDPATGRSKVIGRAVVNLWTDPPPGWQRVRQPTLHSVSEGERATAAMFDGLIFNVDRHSGNWYGMIDPQGAMHITAIDPSLAFPFVRDAAQGTFWKNTAWTDGGSKPINASDLNRLAALLRHEGTVRAEFEALIGQNATDGMFKRARWMYQHGRTLSTRDLDSKVWWDS